MTVALRQISFGADGFLSFRIFPLIIFGVLQSNFDFDFVVVVVENLEQPLQHLIQQITDDKI